MLERPTSEREWLHLANNFRDCGVPLRGAAALKPRNAPKFGARRAERTASFSSSYRASLIFPQWGSTVRNWARSVMQHARGSNAPMRVNLLKHLLWRIPVGRRARNLRRILAVKESEPQKTIAARREPNCLSNHLLNQPSCAKISRSSLSSSGLGSTKSMCAGASSPFGMRRPQPVSNTTGIRGNRSLTARAT